mmetsp:Transcript_17209/g.49781  ORF Transcript_17209/g.49781 Transcript_17209/m.49781 type:complete len:315 (+) Transcript_17209:1-945(+)
MMAGVSRARGPHCVSMVRRMTAGQRTAKREGIARGGHGASGDRREDRGSRAAAAHAVLAEAIVAHTALDIVDLVDQARGHRYLAATLDLRAHLVVDFLALAADVARHAEEVLAACLDQRRLMADLVLHFLGQDCSDDDAHWPERRVGQEEGKNAARPELHHLGGIVIFRHHHRHAEGNLQASVQLGEANEQAQFVGSDVGTGELRDLVHDLLLVDARVRDEHNGRHPERSGVPVKVSIWICPCAGHAHQPLQLALPRVKEAADPDAIAIAPKCAMPIRACRAIGGHAATAIHAAGGDHDARHDETLNSTSNASP